MGESEKETGRDGGWMKRVQDCVAEQHESESGPQLGESWGSLLLTACNSVEQGL